MQHFADMIFPCVVLYKPSISGSDFKLLAEDKVREDTVMESLWSLLLLGQSKADDPRTARSHSLGSAKAVTGFVHPLNH